MADTELNISPDEKVAGVPLARLLRNLDETSYNEGSVDLACRLTDCKAVIEQLLQQRALASRPAEVDDSLADAKRLDWLQSTNQTFCGNYSNTGFRAIGSSIWHGTLREAIDGAMIEAAPSHTTNKDGA